VLGPALRDRLREGQAGAARLLLMRARDVFDATCALLKSNPRALLCDKSDCEACNIARRMLATS
jgi:hypothetical protein